MQRESRFGGIESLPVLIDTHIGGISIYMLCAVCLLPLLVLAISPVIGIFEGQHVLYLLTYSAGILGFFYALYRLLVLFTKNNAETVRGRVRGSMTVVFLAAMLLWSSLSTVLSSDPLLCLLGDSLWREGLLTQFSYVGLFFLAVKLPSMKSRRRVLDCLTAAGAVMALVGLLNIASLFEFFEISRDKAIYLNTNHYGYFLSMALPLSAVLLISEDFSVMTKGRRAAVWIIRIAETALLSHAMIMCRSLGPLIGAVVGLAAMIPLAAASKKRRTLRCAAVVLMCFAVMAVSSINTWDLQTDVALRVEDTAAVIDVTADPEKDATELFNIGSGRGKFWYNAVLYIARHPIFGCGPDNIKAAYEEVTGKYEVARPHSEPLQYAMSIGIPGLLFYLAALWCLLRAYIVRFKALDSGTVLLFCVIGSYLINSLVGNTKFYTTPYFFIMLGMAYAATKAAAKGNG